MSERPDRETPPERPQAPDYILSQAEFHQTVGGLQATVDRQVAGLRTTGGWLFVSIGLWALLIGFTILTGNEKGRP
ncbi:MAG TPA: hypothetical protein VNY83_07510 [Solirubrobacterales bacterium]|jgi:hypothetical protein|nr:hypothetical protein [Solirubrobacterales bacterium]